MVKLRVAVRIIPEDAYLASTDAAPSTPLRGEKKFPVIVRNPEDWYIGTLAVEIKQRYESLYKHPLGQIKYLKDNEDDCDLDPELVVSDLLVDEGKAAQDGRDQHVTIKVVQEQGRALRFGSVVPDLTPVHYQSRVRPPVPTFNEVPSSLGKRSFGLVNGDHTSPPTSAGNKRLRELEIQETQERDGIVASVERSPELIQDTQSSQELHTRPEDVENSAVKAESPEMRRSLHNVQPATRDELEELSDQPDEFPEWARQRSNVKKGLVAQSEKPNGRSVQNHQSPTSEYVGRSQVPITPPSEHASDSTQLQRTSQTLNSSGKRFKQPERRDIYAFPESDIDDSQMSPRSKARGLGVPRFVKRIFGFEDASAHVARPATEQSASKGLNNTEDLISSLETDRSLSNRVSEHLRDVPTTSGQEDDAKTKATDKFQTSTNDAELPRSKSKEPNHFRMAPVSNAIAHPIQSDIMDIDEIPDSDRENVAQTQQPPRTHEQAEGTGPATSITQPISNVATPITPAPKARQKKPTDRTKSLNQVGDQPKTAKTDETPTTGTKRTPKTTAPKRADKTPSLDSPGEQLSHSLQESAKKRTSIDPTSEHSQTKASATNRSKPTEKTDEVGQVDSLQPGKRGKKESPKARTGSSRSKTEKSVAETVENQNDEQKEPAKQKKQRHTKIDKAVKSTMKPVHQPPQSTSTDPSRPLTNGTVTENISSAADPRSSEPNTSVSMNMTRKNGIPLGFTEEEYLLMKSREGMTKEEYEAQKKRKQQLEAEERRKRESAVRQVKSVTPIVDLQRSSSSTELPKADPEKVTDENKTDKAKTTEIQVSAQKKVPALHKSSSTTSSAGKTGGKEKPDIPDRQKEATKTLPAKIRVNRSSSSESTASSSSSGDESIVEPTPKTPSKSTVKPAATNASTKKPSTQMKTPIPNGSIAKPQSTKVSAKSTPVAIAKPTVLQNPGLRGLRASLQASASASKSASPAPKSILKPTKPVLNVSSSSDDESSSSEESEDEDEKSKRSATKSASNTKGKAKTVQLPKLDPTIRNRSVSSDDDSGDD